MATKDVDTTVVVSNILDVSNRVMNKLFGDKRRSPENDKDNAEEIAVSLIAKIGEKHA